jgi:hypothetical protein
MGTFLDSLGTTSYTLANVAILFFFASKPIVKKVTLNKHEKGHLRDNKTVFLFTCGTYGYGEKDFKRFR